MAESKTKSLTILNGPDRGKQVEVSGTFLIGRSRKSDLVLDDMQVSRRHAEIIQNQSCTIIHDLKTPNGTFVSNQSIRSCMLKTGEVIKIGNTELCFENMEEVIEMTFVKKQGVLFEDDQKTVTIQADSADNIYKTFFHEAMGSDDIDKLKTAPKRLAALYEASQIISGEHDLEKLFAHIMDQIFSLVPAQNGVILLKETGSNELITEYVKTDQEKCDVRISKTIVMSAYEDGNAVITSNAGDDERFDHMESIIAENITSVMCTPLKYQGEILGVFYVDTRLITNAFTESDLELLVALSGSASIAIKNAQYLSSLKQAYQETLVTVVNAIEMRDHYTAGHTWRVTNFALKIAGEMGYSDEKLREIEMGGVLHDVGKIAVKDAILTKPLKLNSDEYEKIKIHPQRGARMLQDSRFLLPLVPYVLSHHERYDGEGYPFGLKGNEIPIEGRIMAVADTFDAMTSNRPYRKGFSPEIAIAEIEKYKGTQFDPGCTDAFVKCYHEGKLQKILQNHYKNKRSIICPFCSTHIQIPENAVALKEFECQVCRRRIRLLSSDDVFSGELVAGIE